ncbi:glucuronate isomerase, partial [Bacillus pumilus]|uniref:glucuronate isomerase n=1 Tax=Bacillus pumilus TaxID=1408 RepID=UPI0034D9797C
MDFFHQHPSFISHHPINQITYQQTTQQQLHTIFHKTISPYPFTQKHNIKFKTHTFIILPHPYSQPASPIHLHINPLTNNNTKIFQTLPPHTPYHPINHQHIP